MKKLSYLMMGALAFTFAACEDGPSEVPVQSNPQGPVVEESALSVAPTGPLTTGSVIDLANYESTQIQFAQVTAMDSLVADGTVTYTFEYASKEDFSDAIKIATTCSDNNGYVLGDDLQTAHIALFGKKPEAQTVYYRSQATLTLNGVDYLWGGPTNYPISGSYQESIPVTIVLEDAYYLIGTCNSWAVDNSHPFNHSSASVYDDPEFTISFTVNEGEEFWWKIAPQSAIDTGSWDNVIGVAENGSTALSGELLDGNPGAGLLTEAGDYKMTINVADMTYEIKQVLFPDMLYCVGQGSDWKFGDDCPCIKPINEDGEFKGVIHATDNVKFTDYPDWGYGDWGGADGILVDGGSDIPVITGLNGIYVNLDSYTYEITSITSVGVVGGFSSAFWDIENYYEMTPNEDSTIWTWTGDLEGVEWKIAFNHGWAFSYGGSAEDPVFDGGNISGYSGTHTVTIAFTGHFPTITVE